jgi:predicted transcriptional regulator
MSHRKGTDMPTKPETQLSRRERQIMDIIYAMGQASVAQVHEALEDRPSYSSVRALMRILEDKEHLKHTAVGNRYVYMPTRSRKDASRSAIRRLLRTFFDDSAEQALAALLESSESTRMQDELDRMAELIDNARKEER